MSYNEPRTPKQWVYFGVFVSIYVFIMMVISGYIWLYNINIVYIGTLPLDIGYGIPLAGSILLAAIFGMFFFFIDKMTRKGRRRKSRLDFR